jgi:hypothetical protein
MTQHDIPEEWIPHDDMYFQSPECSHNTVDQKRVVEYQKQEKSRNKGYLYNSNQLTFFTSTEGLMKRDCLLCPLDGEYIASSTAGRRNFGYAASSVQKM